MKKAKERDSETLKNQEQEHLEAACREQERLDAIRQEQERIKMKRAHLFSQLENTHLAKLKEFESRYLSEKKRLHHELLQIEKSIQKKMINFLSCHSFAFREKISYGGFGQVRTKKTETTYANLRH